MVQWESMGLWGQQPAFAADPVMLPHQGCSPPKLPEAHKTKNAKHQMCPFFTFVFHIHCFSMFFFPSEIWFSKTMSFCRFNPAPQTTLAVSGPCGRRCHNGNSEGSEATPGCSRPTESVPGHPPQNPLAWFIGQNRRIPTTTHEYHTKIPLHREKEVKKGRWMYFLGSARRKSVLLHLLP